MSSDNAPVRSLDRGLRMIELFTSQHPRWTVAGLAEELQLPLASAHRLAATLERSGYLERDRPRGQLRLGLKLLYLGSVVQDGLDIREVARPSMRELATVTGDTTVLAVPGVHSVVCVEHIDGTYPIRPHALTVGEHRPYNAGAIGLALLAHLAPADRRARLTESTASLTARTLTDTMAIEARCEEIREAGISYSEGEVVPGTAALAVPIFGAGRQLGAALAVTGIVDRFHDDRRPDVERALRRAGDEISQKLGHITTTEGVGATADAQRSGGAGA